VFPDESATGDDSPVEVDVYRDPVKGPAGTPRGGSSPDELLERAVLRLNGNILGIVLGILGALAIFVATNWLVIKGGDPVGPHLSLLGQYFIGYRVTFVGSLIGMVYAFVVGYLVGRLVGLVYNLVVDVRAR
jgi:ABC-type dipeptide/oligopeptide/nickel transport system permease subunit